MLEQFCTISSDRNVQKAYYSNVGQIKLFFLKRESIPSFHMALEI